MFIYIITALSVLAVICLAAIVAQNARKFDYAQYVIGGDSTANIKQLALALKDVEKVGGVPNVSSILYRIKRGYAVVCAKVRRGESLYECEKWLYENYRSFTLGVRRGNYKDFATLPHRGEARVIHIADTLTAQTYCDLNATNVAAAVHEFCRYTPLGFDEICALKGAFEVALLKKIAFVSDKIRTLEKVRRRAEEDREPDMRLSKKEGYLYYYKSFGKRIPEKFLGKNTQINVENLDFAFAGAMTDYAKVTSNAIRSLKDLSRIFTEDFLISLSPVNGYFDRDKAYRESDGASKEQYLSAVSKLSRYFNCGEYAIAKGAFDLAARFDRHFGEIIFDYRYNLRAHVKGRYVAALKKKSYTLDKWIYYGSIFLMQAVFALLAGIFLPPVWLRITVSALTFIAAYPPCAYITERVLSFFLPKRPVPRMNYAAVPEEGATAVVVSHYIANKEQAEKAVRDLLAVQAVNRDKNVCYFALCDLKESKSEREDGDVEIINALEKYGDRENLVILVRKRVKTGKTFGAYERKRGAVRDFNEFMLSGDRGKFRFVSRDFDFKPHYVMLLDADSRLSAGEVKAAVNTALHPLNAKFDLLTFESVTSLSSLNTRYSRKFAESSGFQTYGDYDDFYFNLCDRAVFCGKGIYDLETFHSKTASTIPDGKVLSHDVIEGATVNTGALNLAVSEDAPDTFVSDTARHRRWMRGDLLLLPFAGAKYCSDGIYTYVILKNAFSCLAPIAACVLWILALYTGYAAAFISVFFASFSAYVASLAIACAYADGIKSSALFKKIVLTVIRAVADVALLPFYAIDNIKVAAGTFFDYIFNSRSLLKWKPFAQLQGSRGYASHATIVVLPCFAMAAVAAALYTSIAVAVYALVFLIAINAVYFAGKKGKKYAFKREDEALLSEYAKKTYDYFASLGTGVLPCDNVQIYPPKGKSATTSPTNIGYTLLSYVCAAELGINSIYRAHSDIAALIGVCEDLQKWKGHLYNWYDVSSLKPVNPYFISSVDSGNFVAALTVCKEFCAKNSFFGTSSRCKKLIDETDFSALTDKSDNRLYIGYNVGAERYEGHYDLLASEARLTAYIASCRSGDTSLWRALSRIQLSSHGNVLASWSGSAFEYLMPELFLPKVSDSLITSSAQRAVKTFYSTKCNNLWGISESGYYAFDENANYQYKAHGLSKLALRSADDRCVISPYSSALAIDYAPEKALDNLRRLQACGGYGDTGFYEAIDFTAGKNTVSSHMTHHQGMILCALTNALKDGAVKKYFMSDDCMRGGELMLEEPENVAPARKQNKKDFVYSKKDESYVTDVELAEFPKVALLYGREYGVVIDDYGCGYSRWRDKDVNAFSHDFYKNSGAFGYFVCDKEVFSPTFAPLKKDGGSYKVRYSDGAAEYFNLKSDCSLKVYTPAVISGEVREYTVKNDSDRLKNYEFVFAERVALAGRREYRAHPAFCDLFVNARFDKENKTVYLKRRPRESTGGFTVAATMLAGTDVDCECNRLNLYGRNRGDADLKMQFGGEAPSVGDVITPCIGLKCAFSLSPGKSKKIALIVQCAEDERTLENRVAQVLGTDFLGYASHKATDGQTSALSKYLSDRETAVYAGKLAAKLLYEPYNKNALIARVQDGSVFSFDEKTVVLKYDGNAAFTKKAVKSAIACRLLGINLRLIILYDERENYGGETASEICQRSTVSDLRTLDFVNFIDVNSYKPQDVKSLLSKAFWVMKEFDCDCERTATIAVRRRSGNVIFEDCDIPHISPCGNGGFDENGDYIVTSVPSAPYSNVVCKELGGFVTTENGGGFAYFLNSQANKLSGWSNDPVSDTPYERLLISDGASVIRVNKLNKGGYVRHARGYSEYISKTSKAHYTVRKSLAFNGQAHALILDIKNLTDKTLSLDVTYLIEPCADSDENRADVFSEREGEDAVRVFNARTGREFYLLAKGGAELITDCAEALSRGVNGFNPKRAKSAFNNPLCGANVRINVKKKTVAAVEFVLCDGADTLKKARETDIFTACAQTEQTFNNLSRFSLKSEDKQLERLYSYLPYQVVSSRLNGRCGFYQAGGATGFRDQLQDCLALLASDPARVREHILLCAERQYIEGDVMHWWHAPAFGVRTRITDDRLFLPYVTCEYIASTGDESVLEEKRDYLVGAPLDGLQEARLEHGRYAGAEESLLMHLQRAIDSAIVTGEHGLLLIGGGDWNDALNELGLRGRGESVWLTMFAVAVIDKFVAYIDADSAKRYKKVAEKLRKAIDGAYFDGRWARAFTDDGEWLGVKKSRACRTDLICQCWAQIIGAGTDEMRKRAMKAAKSLVDENAGAVKLFSPPFDGRKRYGYISSYPEGVRENGGQYTHAAVWYLLACCRAGDKEEANRVLKLLNPVLRCENHEKNAAYKAEPYVSAADVYTNKDNEGRAGWTWYTGSAAWLYKVITEEMLGIKKRGETLEFSTPMLDGIEKVVVGYDYKGTQYRIKFANTGSRGIRTGGVNYTNSTVLPLKAGRGVIEVTVQF